MKGGESRKVSVSLSVPLRPLLRIPVVTSIEHWSRPEPPAAQVEPGEAWSSGSIRAWSQPTLDAVVSQLFLNRVNFSFPFMLHLNKRSFQVNLQGDL